ncbi:MAG: hypothetical protein AAGE94_09845 [Acidobacteriota bacterium]
MSCPRYRALSSLLALLLLAVVLVACEEDDGDDGGGGPTAPEPFLRLLPDLGNGPRIELNRDPALDGANLRLEVVAQELQNVRTIDFILTYPGNLMDLTASEVGTFLGAGVISQIVALDANRVQVFLTGVGAGGQSGDGVVWRADFQGTAPGTGRIEFENPEAARPDGIVLDDITWLGGGVEVSP